MRITALALFCLSFRLNKESAKAAILSALQIDPDLFDDLSKIAEPL